MQRGWTDKEVLLAKRLRYQRVTEAKIAGILGRSRGSIAALFRRHELPSAKPVLNKVSIPPDVLAERDRRANEYHPPLGDPPFSQSALASLARQRVRSEAEKAYQAGPAPISALARRP